MEEKREIERQDTRIRKRKREGGRQKQKEKRKPSGGEAGVE